MKLLETVPIPGTGANTTGGKMYVFDISWVDQGSQTYYLADRSNAVIDIADTKTDTLLGQLSGGFKGFTGNNGASGPDGVTTGGHCRFVTDAPSRVVLFDTSSFPSTMVSAVSTASGDLNRADELDPGVSLWSAQYSKVFFFRRRKIPSAPRSIALCYSYPCGLVLAGE